MYLLEELLKLISKLDEENIDYALCGGLAMAVYALPRATLDIDIMITVKDLDRTKHAAFDLGYDLTSLPMTFRGGDIVIHRLNKLDSETGENIPLDMLITNSATEKAWNSRVKIDWAGRPLWVVSPEGLISLKSIRKSGQDQDDIHYLEGMLNED